MVVVLVTKADTDPRYPLSPVPNNESITFGTEEKVIPNEYVRSVYDPAAMDIELGAEPVVHLVFCLHHSALNFL